MKDKFVLKYRQFPKDQGQPRGPGTSRGRKHTYLHDQRASDPLVEYLEDLESE